MTATSPRPTSADIRDDSASRQPTQYSARRILGAWAAAALPMGAPAWIGAPLLQATFEGPSAWPRAILLCLTVGMIWQSAFVMISVRREQGSLRWPVLKDAL